MYAAVPHHKQLVPFLLNFFALPLRQYDSAKVFSDNTELPSLAYASLPCLFGALGLI